LLQFFSRSVVDSRKPIFELPLKKFLQFLGVVECDVIGVCIFIDEKYGYSVEKKSIVVLSVLRPINKRFDTVLYLPVEIEESDRDDNHDKVQNIQCVNQTLLCLFIVRRNVSCRCYVARLFLTLGSCCKRGDDIEGVCENEAENKVKDGHFNEGKKHRYS
jgi:hypothetical protein